VGLAVTSVSAPVKLTLELQVATRSPSAPAGAEVVLRDPAGTVCAYGTEAADGYLIHFPGVADFSFRPGHAEVVAKAQGSPELVNDLFRTAVIPLALQASGYEALHASAVRLEDGVAAFCGFSGAGKSTIAYGLSRRGYALWGDDAVVFAPQDDVVCFQVPFTLSVRDPARSFFGAPEAGAVAESVDDTNEFGPLKVIIVLERLRGTRIHVERMTLSEAIPVLLPHAYRFTLLDRVRARRTLEGYLEVASRVPVVRVQYEPSLAELPRLLDAIESAVTNVPERA
jgi:hypothetical protein